MTRTLMSSLTPLWIGLVVFVIGMVMIVSNHAPLSDYDEAIYAQVAREMRQSGDYLTPTWAGNLAYLRSDIWLEKPPLYIWALASVSSSRDNEIALRSVSLIFLSVSIVLLYLIVRAIAGSRILPFVAIGFLFCIPFYWTQGMQVMMDVPLAVCFLSSGYGFSLLLKSDKRGVAWFWFGLAMGTMIKSILGLFPIFPVFVYSIFFRDLSWLRFAPKKHVYGFLFLLLIILPWPLYQLIVHRDAFLSSYVQYHLLQRFAKPLEGHAADAGFYFKQFKEHSVLLAYVAPLALVGYMVSHRWWKNRIYLYWFVFTFSYLLLISIAQTKIVQYMIPLLPLLAILFAIQIGYLLKKFLPLLNRFGPSLISYPAKVVTLVVLVSIVFSFVFQHEAKVRLQQQRYDEVLQAEKELGLWLRDNSHSWVMTLTDFIGPSVVYYSGGKVIFRPGTWEGISDNQEGMVIQATGHYTCGSLAANIDNKYQVYWVKNKRECMVTRPSSDLM